MKVCVIILLITGLSIFTPMIKADSKNKPNILFFMADDMGIGDTSAYLNISLTKGSKPIEKTLFGLFWFQWFTLRRISFLGIGRIVF